ncbi:hypothetical protein [Paraburkholderia diazotrophica]|uniref:hypothetical protein n=1 Tax=Paraburkholderia diazotrophica TaxID=667676 RepID=UPI00317B5B56
MIATPSLSSIDGTRKLRARSVDSLNSMVSPRAVSVCMGLSAKCPFRNQMFPQTFSLYGGPLPHGTSLCRAREKHAARDKNGKKKPAIDEAGFAFHEAPRRGATKMR